MRAGFFCLVLCCQFFIAVDAAMLFWQFQPDIICGDLGLAVYFDLDLMTFKGGCDQFEVAKVLHLPDRCLGAVFGFFCGQFNKLGPYAQFERIALGSFKPVGQRDLDISDCNLRIRERHAGEKVHGRGADKIAHKGGGGPLKKLFGRADLHNAPVVHHDDLMGKGHGLILIVGDVDQG